MLFSFTGAFLTVLSVSSVQPTIATPTTINGVLGRAQAGENIKLASGTYPPIFIRDRHWIPSVMVDATRAKLRSVRLDVVSGLTWQGGVFDGEGVATDGFKIEQSDHISIDAAAFHDYTSVGIMLGRTTDAKATNNVFTGSGSDGIDVAMSQRIVLDHNTCTDSRPTYGAHPDCIQMWSKTNFPPTADIILSNNVVVGDTQGFTGFDGPYDRITIEHNYAKVTVWHGITLYNCRHCIVRHNRVDSLPNASHPDARAWILIKGDNDVISCDNKAKAYPGDPGRKKCR